MLRCLLKFPYVRLIMNQMMISTRYFSKVALKYYYLVLLFGSQFSIFHKKIQLERLIKGFMNTSFTVQQLKGLSIMGNQTHRAIIFCIMVLAWGLFYNLVNVAFKLQGLSKKKQYDTKNRIVSMTHGVITFIWSICLYLPYPVFSQPNTQQETMICMFSLAYSVYDLLACIYYGLADAGLYLHHLCCAVGFGTGVFTGYGAIDGIGGLLIAQASNFPMHLRCILRNYNLKYTKSYELSQNFYIFLYILFRGVFGPFIVLYPCLTSTSPIPVKIVCSLLIIQSFYYIWNMAKIIQKKIRQSKEMTQKKIEFRWTQQIPELQKLSFYKKKSDEPKIF